MAKTPPNNGKPWTPADKAELKKLATQNTPTRVAALKLGRTPEAIESQASRQGTSLKPTNRSPDMRRRKSK